MNSQSRHDSSVEDEAALWAARLDGDVLDADQRAALDAWLAESPAHRTRLSQYCQFSADLEAKVQALLDAGAVTLPAPNRAKRHRRWKFPGVTSVALAAAAAIAAAVWVALPKPQIETIAVGVAQRGSRTLADGTRVELNAHTSLLFENSRTERRARLAGGEALFAVSKDAARPFIVDTPNGSVRVTGTTFNVRTDGAGVSLEVTVIEGSVQVRPAEPAGSEPSGPIALGAGDQLTAGAKGISTRTLLPAALEDALAWREGKIVFDDVPLHEVAARLGRHHGRRLIVAPSVANERVGGVYGLDDFDEFVAALEVALPVRASKEPSGAVSIRARTAR